MVDNLIRLFGSEDTEFETNGFGVLSDAETCEVTEERNGEFELEMVYPISGRHYSDIGLRKIIVTKSNPYSSPQPFRIYSISKPINGLVTINAEHISYDLSGYPVSAFKLDSENNTIQNTFDAFLANCVRDCPFTLWTNKIATKKFTVSNPRSIRSLLAGSEGSITDIFGTGEYEFDGFDVRFWMSRGEDKGVSIRYGKNLTNIEQEENCSSIYTAVYPFWYQEADKKSRLVILSEAHVQDGKDSDNNPKYVDIPEKIIQVKDVANIEGEFGFEKILALDLSDKFTDAPKPLELFKAAKDYIKNNEIWKPKVSIDVSFEALSKTSDYGDYAILETIKLCDTVYVEFPDLGVSATAKCVKTIYDVLSDKYKKVELGSIKNNLANSLSSQSKALSSAANKTYVDKLIDESVMAISGNSGGYVVIRDSRGGKEPNEILIMNTPDVKTASQIWRWNMSGLSYSDKNNPENDGLAITMDGKIVADFIAGNTIQGVAFQSAPVNNEILFSVTKEGYLTATHVDISGTINATGGTIGDCEIQNGVLKIGNDNVEGTISATHINGKNLSITDGTFTGTITASAFQSTPVDVGEKDWQNNPKLTSLFEVTKEGQVFIRSEAIVNKLKVSQLEADQFILSGETYGTGVLDDIIVDENEASAFELNKASGLLKARNAVIRGAIYASAGEIAGLVMTKENLTYDNTKVSKILRSLDNNGNVAFEIRVSEAGSEIEIRNINCNVITSKSSIYAPKIYAGNISMTNSGIYQDGDMFISFKYTQSGNSAKATLMNSWNSSTIRIKITNQYGNDYNLQSAKKLSFMIHYTWGGWSDVKTLTIPAGQHEISQQYSGTFWGYDDAKFVETDSKELDFIDSGNDYFEFKRSIEPYSTNYYDCGSLRYAWKNLFSYGLTILNSDYSSNNGSVSLTSRDGELCINGVKVKFEDNGRITIGSRTYYING